MKKISSKPAAFSLLLAFIATLAVCSVGAEQAAGRPNLTIENITAAQDDFVELGKSSMGQIHVGDRTFFTSGTSATKTMFIGDSNVEQYWPRVEKLMKKQPTTKAVVFANSGLCLPVPGLTNPDHLSCAGFIESALAYADRPDIDTVVIAAEWVGAINDVPLNLLTYQDKNFKGLVRPGSEAFTRAFASFERMMKALTKKGKRVFLVLNIPVNPAFDPKNLVVRSATGLQLNAPQMDEAAFLLQYDAVISKLKEAGKSSGATVIDPLATICDGKYCPSTTTDGDPIYKDGYHLRAKYVRDHATFIDQTLR